MIPKRNAKIKNRWWLVLLLFSLTIGYWGEMLYMKPTNPEHLKSKIEFKLSKEKQRLNKELQNLINTHQEASDSLDFIYTDKWKKAVDGLAFFVYKNDSLVFWNSNELVLPGPYAFSRNQNKILRVRNAQMLWNKVEGDKGYTYIGILPIQMIYPIKNDYIQTHYNPALGIPEFTPFHRVASPGLTMINDDEGHILFYLDLDETTGRNDFLKYLSLFGYSFSFLVLLLLWASVIGGISDRKRKNQLIFATFPLAIGLIFILGQLNAPAILYETQLFSPEIFGMPGLFRNLGIILIFSLLWLFAGIQYHRHLSLKIESSWLSGISLLVMMVVFHELSRLFLNLVGHSTISFELNNIEQLDVYSFVAHLILLCMFGGWFLIADKTLRFISLGKSFGKSTIAVGILSVTLIGVYIKMEMIEMAIPLSIAICLLFFSIYTKQRKTDGKGVLTLFTLSAFIAVLGVSLTWSFGLELDRAKETTLLLNRASGIHNEHDPFAEMGLIEINDRLGKDPGLNRMFQSRNPDVERIDRYIHQQFFSSNWQRYDIQVVVCWPDSELDISDQDENNDCYDYFQGLIAETGEELDENGLFYLNNRNGRISYFIWHKVNAGKANEASVFIDLESRLSSVGRGYPELVRDMGSSEGRLSADYSFARYVDDILISNTGSFSYNISGNWVKKSEDEFSIQKHGGYQHLLYKPVDGACYVLSKATPGFSDVLLYFIYLFLYLFMLIFVFTSSVNLNKSSISKYSLTLESRIRSAILFVLMLSFVLIGFASVYYNFKQFRHEQVESLKDKTRSVLVMMDQLVTSEDVLHEMDNVELIAYLRSISNSLYVDINLYNPAGMLLASSRPELFNRHLQGKEMNAAAFNDLNRELLPWSLQEEALGKKRYLSAYKAIYNWDNRLVGYVNLPHFVSADEAAEEQLDFVVVILNIYLFFVVFAIFLTVLLSRQITRPLQVIKEKLSGFRLRETNEKIQYSGRDEIANLVNEYNRLVDELESGAEQLVTTERTSAWREMARQIAHEIKNPLTPMKLSIQHLQRAKRDNHERFDDFFEKTSITLIEQIDNLSRIASEFSSFSKMSASNPEKLDVSEPVKNVVDLFRETKNVKLDFKGIPDKLYVWADKDQLIQVFNNLVKNAIQAIPQDREGEIYVHISTDEENVTISVRDNGTGIAEEAKAKLFEPNFTTKRTGMGIGLAITRNIIHSFKGEIWFENYPEGGTIFYVQLPKYTFS